MKETISALMDGELDARSAAQAIDALARTGECSEAWRVYHLISDSLGESRMLSAGFSARVAFELEREPTVLAPSRPRREPPSRSVALAAGVAAVALVGWVGFAPQQPSPVAPVAQLPPAAPQQATPAVVPLPRGTGDYLLAHQGFSPRMSLQGMAPYARTVSEQVREPRK